MGLGCLQNKTYDGEKRSGRRGFVGDLDMATYDDILR